MARLLWAIATAVLGFTLSFPFVASDSATATPSASWRDVSVLDYVPSGVTPDGSHLQLALSGNGAGIVVQTWTWGGQTFVPTPLVTDNVVVP